MVEQASSCSKDWSNASWKQLKGSKRTWVVTCSSLGAPWSLLAEQIAFDFTLNPENCGYWWCMQDLLPPAIPLSELSRLHRNVCRWLGSEGSFLHMVRRRLVGVSNYNVELSNLETGFHCKTRCRFMVMSSLNLHVRVLGDLSFELFFNILFHHIRKCGLCYSQFLQWDG